MDEILDFFINLIADIMELVIECILPWKAKNVKKQQNKMLKICSQGMKAPQMHDQNSQGIENR